MGSKEVGRNIVHIDWEWNESVLCTILVRLRTKLVHGDAEKVDIYRRRNQRWDDRAEWKLVDGNLPYS